MRPIGRFMSDDPIDSTLVAAPLPSHPEHLGPCRLLEAIGRGGMGAVYLAEMVEDRAYAQAGGRVAVKVLHAELLRAPGIQERFLREGQLGIRLRHPAIIQTHEVDAQVVGSDTYHFLVMEFVEGRTMGDLMRELRTVPESLLRHLACQIAQALQAVHDAGAIHRDLKPENIRITPDHQVKLMDLGIAYLVEEAARLTSTGQFIGTLAYASPEQFGMAGVGPPSDLYSMGVVLFEAATGAKPFSRSDFAGLMRCHLEEVPQGIRKNRSVLTPFLEEVVACLLEKDPGRRFDSASALAGVLEEGEASAWWRKRDRRRRLERAAVELPRIRVPRETRLVGRDRELETLRSLYGEAREGRGKLLLIEGEAGVGRTRLLAEFVRGLDEGGENVRVLYGSFPPGKVGSGHGALSQAILDHFGEVDLEAKLAPSLAAMPALVPAFSALLAGGQTPPGSEPLSVDALHSVFCHLARGLAAERPLVWVIEDFHFGSAEGRSLLLSLARIAHDLGLLLVATTREGFPPEDQAHLDRLDVTHRLTLDRLSAEDVGRMLEEAFGSGALAEEIGDRVAARTDGNPFFILEMIRELKEGGLLAEGPDGSYAATSRIESFTVPSSVRDLLLARLEDLDKEERAMLGIAAVQGFRFDPDLVARVRESRRLEVLESLADLEHRLGIVRSTGTGFEFDNHQLREVVYESHPPMLRAEYHGMLAEAYEERGHLAQRSPEEMQGEAVVFLAEHYLKGGRKEQGIRLLLPALDTLARSYDSQALLDLAGLGLEVLAEGEESLRCDILLRQAGCFDLLGSRAEQRSAVEGAIRAAEAAGDTSWAAKGHARLTQLLIRIADYPAAREAVQECARLAREAGEREIEARAAGLLGLICQSLGKYDEARRQHEESLDLCRQGGDRRGEAYAGGNLGNALRHLGQYREARETFEKYIALCHEIGDRRGEAMHAGSLGQVFLDLGCYEEARENLERQLALCREIGDRRVEIGAAGNLGSVFTHLGHYERAHESLERCLMLCRATGARGPEAITLGNIGPLALMEGRLDEAGERLDECLQLSRELGIKRVEAYALADSGNLARARGEAGEARKLYEEALGLHRDLGLRDGIAETTLALGRHLWEQGEGQAAREMLEEAEAISTELSLGEPGPLPAAYLALLGGRDPGEVAVTGAAPIAIRAETHLVLHLAGAGGDHLPQARALVEEMGSHLEGAEREAFWEINPVARMLRKESERREEAGDAPTLV